jgi:hypothetical protein
MMAIFSEHWQLISTYRNNIAISRQKPSGLDQARSLSMKYRHSGNTLRACLRPRARGRDKTLRLKKRNAPTLHEHSEAALSLVAFHDASKS